MKTGFEECILFSYIKSCIQEVCPVSLVKATLQASLTLFWTRSSTKNFYKITQNSSFSITSPEHTNYNLLGRHVVHSPYIAETLMAKDIVIFPLQQLGFALDLKKSVLTPTQRIEFLRVTVDLLIMTLSLPEKKVSMV